LLQATLVLYTSARLEKGAGRWARCEERAETSETETSETETSETAGILPGFRKHLRGRGDAVHFEEAGGMEETTEKNSARLLIADDHALVREGLRTMLSGEDGIRVIGEANNGQEALSMCRDLRPDLVLMDVRMPVMDGLEATQRIKEEMPQTSVVMVTMHENPDYLFEAIKAGAAGYVLKDASGERLLGAVRRTLEGESPLNQELAMRLLVRLARERGEGVNHQGGSQDVEAGANSSGAGSDEKIPAPEAAEDAEHRAEADRIEALTPREIEVLTLLSQGQTNPQIAQHLMVSRGTVKIHVQHIISKLGVSDRTQAAVRAIEAGVIGGSL
jgi:DNA-binding NarL/FixJ family response regulator